MVMAATSAGWGRTAVHWTLPESLADCLAGMCGQGNGPHGDSGPFIGVGNSFTLVVSHPFKGVGKEEEEMGWTSTLPSTASQKCVYS